MESKNGDFVYLMHLLDESKGSSLIIEFIALNLLSVRSIGSVKIFEPDNRLISTPI